MSVPLVERDTWDAQLGVGKRIDISGGFERPVPPGLGDSLALRERQKVEVHDGVPGGSLSVICGYCQSAVVERIDCRLVSRVDMDSI